MGLKRSPMKQGTVGLKRTAMVTTPKPQKGPRPVRCKNRACRQPFVPDRPSIRHCSQECGHTLAMEVVTKRNAAKAKAERAEHKRKKDEGMRHQDRLELVQKLVNKVAVLRDHADGCISCDKGPNWYGVWHGSHFKSVGSNSALRFNLWNIAKSCSQCNWHKGGNIAEYEPRLAIKIGAERLDWIKHHPKSREYSTEYLIRLAAIMRRKIKRLERRISRGDI